MLVPYLLKLPIWVKVFAFFLEMHSMHLKFGQAITLLTPRTPAPREHDDVIKWKHFPRYWPFVRGIHPHKGLWRGALIFSLICAWINGWVNNLEAGDLRRHSANYNVTVMGDRPTQKEQMITVDLEVHSVASMQGPVLLQRSDAVARIPANGSAAFNESCTPIG